VRGVAACAALLLCAAAVGAPLQAVQFDSLDVAADGRPLRLTGYFESPGLARRTPAIVLLHGCSGAWTRSGEMNGRFAAMAALLRGEGYAVLVVDSFAPRGLREICTIAYRDRPVKQRQRSLDAFGALAYLAARADVDAQRIGLIGWSHGGSTTLAVLAENDVRSPRFAAALAFYPGCSASARRGADYAPRTPLAILIGSADDWTPEEKCRALVDGLARRGITLDYHVFPGAHHAFDSARSVRVRPDIPNTAQGTATVGGDAAGRAQAYEVVRRFFGRWLKG